MISSFIQFRCQVDLAVTKWEKRWKHIEARFSYIPGNLTFLTMSYLIIPHCWLYREGKDESAEMKRYWTYERSTLSSEMQKVKCSLNLKWQSLERCTSVDVSSLNFPLYLWPVLCSIEFPIFNVQSHLFLKWYDSCRSARMLQFLCSSCFLAKSILVHPVHHFRSQSSASLRSAIPDCSSGVQ